MNPSSAAALSSRDGLREARAVDRSGGRPAAPDAERPEVRGPYELRLSHLVRLVGDVPADAPLLAGPNDPEGALRAASWG
jgi:hypothetical protein